MNIAEIYDTIKALPTLKEQREYAKNNLTKEQHEAYQKYCKYITNQNYNNKNKEIYNKIRKNNIKQIRQEQQDKYLELNRIHNKTYRNKNKADKVANNASTTIANSIRGHLARKTVKELKEKIIEYKQKTKQGRLKKTKQ